MLARRWANAFRRARCIPTTAFTTTLRDNLNTRAVFPSGQRVVTRSTITGEVFEYFLPARLNGIEAAAFSGYSSSSVRYYVDGTHLPLAAIAASRGRIMLSIDVLEKTRSLEKLANLWSHRILGLTSICELHVQANGKSQATSTYRDSIVWVDGLRPSDANLIPGPASYVLSLMQDYFDFVRRKDIPEWIKLALAHYQILMIHPFFDGNGRLSRILALIRAQRLFGPSRAFAIAAVLSLHRRALATLFDEVRAGNAQNYLAYWGKLIAWSAECATQIAGFRKQAMEKISSSLTGFESPNKLVSFLIDAPLFTPVHLTTKLCLSEKLGQRYIDTLTMGAIIERHPGSNDARNFRCPMALEYWRLAIENTASCSKQLLPS